MSMSTKHATYLSTVGDKLVTLEVSAKGLANEFLEATKSIVTDVIEGSSFTEKKAEVLSAYKIAAVTAEEHVLKTAREKFDDPEGKLSDLVPSWRNYKSVLLNGIEQGINPLDFEQFGKYRNKKIELSKAKKAGKDESDSDGGGSSDAASDVASTTEALPLMEVRSSIPDVERAVLDAALADLALLFEHEPDKAHNILDVFAGRARSQAASLKQVGGRFINAK